MSTIGLKAGCVVTSFTRSPFIQTWRPVFQAVAVIGTGF
jgi:hypothetical protein